MLPMLKLGLRGIPTFVILLVELLPRDIDRRLCFYTIFTFWEVRSVADAIVVWVTFLNLAKEGDPPGDLYFKGVLAIDVITFGSI